MTSEWQDHSYSATLGWALVGSAPCGTNLVRGPTRDALDLNPLLLARFCVPSRHAGRTRSTPTWRGDEARLWKPRCFINATSLLAPSPPIPTSSVPGVLTRSTNQCPQPSRLARLQFCCPQCQNVRKVFKEVNRGRLFLDPTVVRPCCEQRLFCQPTCSHPHPRAPRMPSTPGTCLSPHLLTCVDSQRQLPGRRPQDSRHQVADPGSSPAGPAAETAGQGRQQPSSARQTAGSGHRPLLPAPLPPCAWGQ